MGIVFAWDFYFYSSFSFSSSSSSSSSSSYFYFYISWIYGVGSTSTNLQVAGGFSNVDASSNWAYWADESTGFLLFSLFVGSYDFFFSVAELLLLSASFASSFFLAIMGTQGILVSMTVLFFRFNF